MPRRRKSNKNGRTTYSLAIKKGGKFKRLPRYGIKSQKAILLGKKKTPKLYVVAKRKGRVVKSRRIG